MNHKPHVECNAKEGYHRFVMPCGMSFGSFEVFWNDANRTSGHEVLADNDGWFWHSGFPGCLPDGDPVGPFKTSVDAWHDAKGTI